MASLPLAELDEKAISVPSDSEEQRGRLMSPPPQIDDVSQLCLSKKLTCARVAKS